MNRKAIATVCSTVVVALLTLVFLVTVMKGGRQAQAQSADEANGQASQNPITVQVTTPSVRALTRTLRLPATLMADEDVELLAKASGYISRITVDIGSRVKKGDVLAVIDVPEMMDELRQAEAVLEAKRSKVIQAKAMADTARAEVQRFVAEYALKKLTNDRKAKLRDENAIPEQELDEAKNELHVADALRTIARAVSAMALARAIIGGVIAAAVLSLVVVPCLYVVFKRETPESQVPAVVPAGA